MEVFRSSEAELDTLSDIIEEARGTIAALGIDQWQKGYPNAEVIADDIRLGRSYCVRHEGEVCGTFALIDDGEPTYDKIYDGEWLTGDGGCYLAIHRVAVAVRARGSGASTAIVSFAESRARELRCRSLRIDTHYGNVVMRRMLEKHGFLPCGTIYLACGDPRIAYEKII